MTHNIQAQTNTSNNHARKSEKRRVTFGNVFVSEWHKLWWLGSQKWCAGVLIALSWATAIILGRILNDTFYVPGHPETLGEAGLFIAEAAAAGWPFLAVPMVLFGVFAITSEFGSGMIRSTINAVPNRDIIFWAKLSSFTFGALLVAVITVLGTAFIAAVVTAGTDFLALGSVELVLALLITVGTLVVIALSALAVGWLVRSASGGITLGLGAILLVPMLFGLLTFSRQEWVPIVQSMLPTSLSTTAIMSPFSGFAESGLSLDGGLGATLGLLVWVTTLVVAAWAVQRKRAVM